MLKSKKSGIFAPSNTNEGYEKSDFANEFIHADIVCVCFEALYGGPDAGREGSDGVGALCQ